MNCDVSAQQQQQGSGYEDKERFAKTPLSMLNDIARHNKIKPEFCLENETGPAHEKVFTVKLKLGEDESYVGAGSSIKKAQQEAAKVALAESSLLASTNQKNKETKKSNLPSTVELNTYAAKQNISTKYVLLDQQPYHRGWCYYYRLYIGVDTDLYFDGDAFTHQQARNMCAHNALEYFKQFSQTEQQSAFNNNDNNIKKKTKSDISILYEQAKRLQLPIHFEINFIYDHLNQRTFHATFYVGDETGYGQGQTKQIAKLMAAKNILGKLSLSSPTFTPIRQQRSPRRKKPTKCSYQFKQQKVEAPNYGRGTINPIARLLQIQQAKNKKFIYELINNENDENQNKNENGEKLFYCRLTVTSGNSDGTHDVNDEHETIGSGINKRLAKRNAAEQMLEKLGYSQTSVNILPPPPRKSSLKGSSTINNKNIDNNTEKKHVKFLTDEPIEKLSTTNESKNESTKPDESSDIAENYKQELEQSCTNLNIQILYENQKTQSSPNNSNVFSSILSLSIKDHLLAQFLGQGPNINVAQEQAAKVALLNLRKLFTSSNKHMINQIVNQLSSCHTNIVNVVQTNNASRFNMVTNDSLDDLRLFHASEKSRLSRLLEQLEWSEECLNDHSKFVTCPYNAYHRINEEKIYSHIVGCQLMNDGYERKYQKEIVECEREKEFLNQSVIKLDPVKLANILQKPYPVSVPLTIESTCINFTVNERCLIEKATYDQAKQLGSVPPTLNENIIDLAAAQSAKTSTKSETDLLAELRDRKRRRTKYRGGGVNKKSYYDVNTFKLFDIYIVI
ncbi:unnamed protein product [Didymodactylos carnosus]|uniref:DRBM domain-containing protein n=1 Tax=Didymodactylos carnosus TaxID=1234261 RepID=A0A814UAX7_9BILA|nr:unnamed protein product [Didymodactylos carnosus]CAF1169682.1 unnamed protein product [Didymodactylos carnosus]CAF3747193.1 unnamed protein product [Didymodactylos carnosus]CAF3933403.1 unnamed protein product [Didymodactylos carnosus]